MIKLLRCWLVLIQITFITQSLFGQSLPVGSPMLEDYYRRSQLLGFQDSLISHTIRPLTASFFEDKNIFKPRRFNEEPFGDTSNNYFGYYEKDFSIIALPINYELRFNSKHPYGWNDGAMIPAAGWQSVFSAGFYLKTGPLSVQFKPEFLFAENREFTGFPQAEGEVLFWNLYYDYYNKVDLPERFGTGRHWDLLLGQSNIKIDLDPISFGISNENLWWGPGMRNSLLMSNTARGFKHFTINTTKPVKTRFGSFEAQVIAGRLEGTEYGPMEPNPVYFGNPIYLAKPKDWRYLAGLAFTWQPKWINGLFLGLTSTKQTYSKDLTFGDYFPTIYPFQKINSDGYISKNDRYHSAFFRWFWPKENAEIYFEYGLANPRGNLRDFALNPDKSRAYVFGLQKLLPFGSRKNEFLQIGLEVTQLQQTSAQTVRSAGAWYVNEHVRHGYTHKGEALGAGIGPGSNLQSLSISWVKGLSKIGLQLERYAHNNDYYYYTFEPSLDWRRHWVDLGGGLFGQSYYKNFGLNLSVNAYHSFNYKWYLQQDPAGPYVVNGHDAFTIHAQLGLNYRF